jgi:phage shock protein C
MPKGQLVRSKSDRVIAGVAGGVAAYFDVDATIVRVVWAIAALSGFGFLLYVALWILLPQGEGGSSAVAIAEERYARGEIGADELTRIRDDLRG